MMMLLTRFTAENALEHACDNNPGPWADHSRYVAFRYGATPVLVRRWKAVLEIKAHFEQILGCSIYDLLPGVMENTFR